jgi:hypothetical protein
MKTSVLFTIVLILSMAVSAQTGDKTMAPAAAKMAFAKAFPGAEKAKWGKEKKGYEVEFSLGGKQMSAVYDKTGAIKETEEDIKTDALPAAVVSYVKAHYPKETIKEAAKITLPGGAVNYEAEVKKKDLIFDAAGKFIREEKDVD